MPLETNPRLTSPIGDLVELAKTRRTVYNITKSSPVSDSCIEQLVNEAILHVPSALNTQSTRLIVLLHAEHDRFWNMVITVFEGLASNGKIPVEMWTAHLKPRMEGLKSGYGTILFYEDPAHIPRMFQKFPMYKDHFPAFAQHTNAMHQYFLWVSLASLGLGANLQHYNPMIDAETAKLFNLPTEWQLIAQMPFGMPGAPPGEKTYTPVEDRVKFFGGI